MESFTYQVFFRTSRGGCGIEYEAAKAEFLSVFRDQRIELMREIPSRMRMDVAITGKDTCSTDGLSNEGIAHRAEKLGYTQGIISVHEEPYRGEELHSYRTGRWAVGWLRKRDRKIFLTEIYRQDEAKLLETAPHRRVFLIERDGEVAAAKGHRYRRGLSPADARFMVNIAELRGDELILDPFAGIGGILIECMERGLKILAADADPVLRPGLAEISHSRCAIADARQLPFGDGIFDFIITEPPFNIRYRQAVLDSMVELRRVIQRGGRIMLLIAQDMHERILSCMARSEFQLTRDFTLRRHGKLISHVLRFDHLAYNDSPGVLERILSKSVRVKGVTAADLVGAGREERGTTLGYRNYRKSLRF
jgi:ubiquinone/menaquinone biosynthesis C-methylase UbiE